MIKELNKLALDLRRAGLLVEARELDKLIKKEATGPGFIVGLTQIVKDKECDSISCVNEAYRDLYNEGKASSPEMPKALENFLDLVVETTGGTTLDGMQILESLEKGEIDKGNFVAVIIDKFGKKSIKIMHAIYELYETLGDVLYYPFEQLGEITKELKWIAENPDKYFDKAKEDYGRIKKDLKDFYDVISLNRSAKQEILNELHLEGIISGDQKESGVFYWGLGPDKDNRYDIGSNSLEELRQIKDTLMALKKEEEQA